MQFEKILPGSFDRIMTMAEQSRAAQIDIASKAQLFLQHDVRRGHYLGALVGIVSIAAALGCAAVGQPVVAVALVGIPVMAVAKALIQGCTFVRAGRYPIYYSPISNRNFPVPTDIKSVHTANEVLKQAGLPKAF